MYCTTAPSRLTAYKTDTYLAEAVANYAGSIDTMHLFVGKTTRNQIVAEYKKKDKEDTQICIGSLSEGKYVFKAGIMQNAAWFLFYTSFLKVYSFFNPTFRKIIS
ncbi:hypothetical protein NXH67_00765 [Butyrivibrio sp. DSM 10294]|uniref:hypothetical protein n=1 Tax=Butyrivibrio sp. DSM 10294 TaxID=2972457 RepID=UPI00234F512F|nr:hypothetical protein [Butyrivibrio sp. DSM 10294]MDC7292049.1 hypothetical protein [Butyrivibrio sp. DSM 10294]